MNQADRLLSVSFSRWRLITQSQFELLGRNGELIREGAHYALTFMGFAREEEVRVFLQKLQAALLWFGIKHSFGMKIEVERHSDPIWRDAAKLCASCRSGRPVRLNR